MTIKACFKSGISQSTGRSQEKNIYLITSRYTVCTSWFSVLLPVSNIHNTSVSSHVMLMVQQRPKLRMSRAFMAQPPKWPKAKMSQWLKIRSHVMVVQFTAYSWGNQGGIEDIKHFAD